MSLQVWLPLNGDLHNQGLSNLQFSLANSTQTVIDDNGKIGKCFKNQGTTSDGIYSNSTINLSSTLSMFCWFKFDSIGSNNINAMITQCATANKEGFILFLHKSSTTSGYLAVENGASTNLYKGSTLLQAGQWYHGGFTYDGANLKLYLNGRLDGEWNNIGGTTLNTYIGIFLWAIRADRTPPIGSSYHFAGYLNDVRIYDHCLSNKEIEEISKGLVLHYKLDNIINNIIYDCSGYNHNGSVIGPFTFNNVPSRYEKSITMNNTNTTNHIECNDVINLPINGITVSFWAYTEKTNNYVLYIDQNMSFAVNSSGGSFYVSRASSAGFPMTEFKTNQWNHVVLIRNEDTYKAYINGKNIPRSQSNNYWTHQVSNIYLLNRKYNNNYAANASVSDFRMYATELTESQIQELYQTSMAIDNNGNGYAREIIEDNNLNITKTGQFHGNKLIDNTANTIASITKNKELKVNNFYEY